MNYNNNNCWWVKHPTINFFTFEAFPVKVFGFNCIIEHYQDGEIWADDEYWGSVLYDFDNDRYTNFPTYINEKDAEEILTVWNERNPDNVWEGKISEDFSTIYDKKELESINFYKDYLNSKTELSLEDFYKDYNK